MPEYGNPWPVPITHNGAGLNQAKWHAIYEDWAEKMMMMGYKVDDLPGIAAQSGEIFPKDLIASIHAKDQLFPGADMGFTYDLAGRQKQRPVSYSDPSLGMMPWEAMDPSEIAAANNFHGWANNAGNASYEAAFGDHNYNAWLAASRGSAPRSANAQGPNGTLSSMFPGASNPMHIQSLGGEGPTSGPGAPPVQPGQQPGTLGSMLSAPPTGGLLGSGGDSLSGLGSLGSLMTLPDEDKQWNQGNSYGTF